jgi:polyferredoxin
MKRFHIFYILSTILYIYLICLWWNYTSAETIIEIFTIKGAIILGICTIAIFSLPSYALASILENIWCKIFKTKNYNYE